MTATTIVSLNETSKLKFVIAEKDFSGIQIVTFVLFLCRDMATTKTINGKSLKK